MSDLGDEYAGVRTLGSAIYKSSYPFMAYLTLNLMETSIGNGICLEDYENLHPRFLRLSRLMPEPAWNAPCCRRILDRQTGILESFRLAGEQAGDKERRNREESDRKFQILMLLFVVASFADTLLGLLGNLLPNLSPWISASGILLFSAIAFVRGRKWVNEGAHA